MSSFTLARSALLTAILAAPLGALAQGAGPTASTPSPAPANPAETAGPTVQNPATPNVGHATGATRESRVEQRITGLHSRLHITPAQETQWKQFADVMRQNAQDMERQYQQRSQRIEQMTAVENMQSYAQLEQERAQDVQKLVPAFQTLYDSLSPDQKRTADQVFRNVAERAQQRHHHRAG